MEKGDDRGFLAWFLLVLCAVVAAFSSTLAFRSIGSNEQYFGLMLMVFSMMLGVVGPILLVLKQK